MYRQRLPVYGRRDSSGLTVVESTGMQLTSFFAGSRRTSLIVILLVALCGIFFLWLRSPNHDALWSIVHLQCIPDQQLHQKPAPCAQVDESAGFVVLKDRKGSRHYLLMPSLKITGIESAVLLEPATPNYFEQAWQARHFLTDLANASIADDDVSFAVNSQFGRSQNQLHIHISCLRSDVKTRLAALSASIGPTWQPLAGGLSGHDYLARRVSATDLHQEGGFRELAAGVAGAREAMGSYSLAMAVLPGGDFVLLSTKRDLLALNLASTEEIQDHECVRSSDRPIGVKLEQRQ